MAALKPVNVKIERPFASNHLLVKHFSLFTGFCGSQCLALILAKVLHKSFKERDPDGKPLQLRAVNPIFELFLRS